MQALHLDCLIPKPTPSSSKSHAYTHSPSNLSFQTFKFHHTISSLHLGNLFFLRPATLLSPSKRRRVPVITAAANVDYYTTLQVPRNASLNEIKSSYRNLARKYHPDKTPGSEEKFKEVSAAYEVLSNQDKRALYDRFGEAGLNAEFASPNFSSQEVDPFQIFESLFGDTKDFFGGEGGGSSRQNLDIWSEISLTFEESVFGGKREIEVPCLEMCAVCGGTGAKSANCVKSCAECGGRGRVMKRQRTPFGVVSQVSTCLSCGGDGKTVTDKCLPCSGLGSIRTKRNFEVVIPPGVVDGATMQLRREGNLDRKRGICGDLYLILHVKEKRGIWREGLNLFSRVSIAYTEAILGTVVKVETIEGSKELRIPSGIQPGESVILPQMGVPKANERGRGDHIFIVDVQIPKTVSDRERKLLEELVSLRSSSEEGSKLVDGDMGEGQTRQKKHHSYQKVNKPGSFIWNSVERLFRRGQTREGFASMNLPLTLWYSRRDSVSDSWFAFFLLSCIFALVTKASYNIMLGNRTPSSRNNRRNKH